MREVYEFFTRYVRRIHPDTHWKRAMKNNPNRIFFQLITPSDIAFVISLLKNGMPVWNRKKVLFETEEMKKTTPKPLFMSGEGQKRSFGRTTWNKEGLKYFHKVEKTWQDTYGDKEQMRALVNGLERWEPDGELKKGKDLLRTNWTNTEQFKKVDAGRDGDDDDNDNDGDDEDGYHSDKYDDVAELPFKLDRGNLRKVTGRDHLVGGEYSYSSDNVEDDDNGDGEDDDKVEILIDTEEETEKEVYTERRSKRHKS